MKKLILCLCLLAAWCGSAYGYVFPGGSGTAGDPWHVGSADDLNAVRDNLIAYYTQIDNIDLSTYANWVPIAGGGTTTLFTGSFDGNGFKITNLTIDQPDTNNVGLFGHVGVGATIRNVRLEGVNIKGARGTGSLAGRVTGSVLTLIERCSADGGTVVGDGATGGLVGSHNSVTETPGGTNNPVTSQCFANIAVSFSGKVGAGKDKFGGLVGCNQKGTIIDSYARGPVTINSANGTRVGGLAGCVELRGIILRSYSTGLVDVVSPATLIGGLVGNVASTGAGNNGVVTDSYWDTQASDQPTSAGGVGRTTEQMKTQTTFVNWDFVDIWAIDTTTVPPEDPTNDGYPYLQWQDEEDPDPGDPPLAIVLSSFSAVFSDGCMAVAWETATEINTVGFYLWRSTEEIGGYVQVDGSYTPSKALMETTGAQYAYADCELDFEGSASYYYKLEEIEAGESLASIFYGPIGPVSKKALSTSAQMLAGKKESGSSGPCFIRTLFTH